MAKKKAAPKKKVAAKAPPASDLKGVLVAKREELQKQIDAIDTLLGGGSLAQR